MNEHKSIPIKGLRICGPLRNEQGVIFDPFARHFLLGLVRAFRSRVDLIRNDRRGRAAAWADREPLAFLEDTEIIRKSDWRVADYPTDLARRIVEITGPVDRKMIINALNSGADVFMADFEDSSAPTWHNMVNGQLNLRDAVRRKIEFTDTVRARHYQLDDNPATLMVRPRGLHLDETHIEVDGRAVPAALFDFGLYFFHNARELTYRGSGPYFYLPKLEHYSEARFWNDVFLYSQDQLGLERGTIRATVLIETLPAAFQMDEILFELREHSAGLNCGRWDYIFSHIKVRRSDSSAVLPDRNQVTMDQPCMRAYSQLLVQTCHRRGIHAIGGMAAQIPIKNDSHCNTFALESVRADKAREVRDGHDGTWVAHPGLVPLAREVFESRLTSDHQIDMKRDDLVVESADLLEIPQGPRTERGLRQNVRVAVQYLEAWIGGNGCVPIDHLMEDTATAEISRAQIWQWRHHSATLVDGRAVTPRLIDQALSEELHLIRSQLGNDRFDGGRFEEATALFRDLCLAEELDEFITLKAGSLLRTEAECSNQSHLQLFQPMIKTEGAPSMSSYETRSNVGVPANRWEGTERPYTAEDVERLRGSVTVEHTLARLGAERLWEMLTADDYVHALGALTGNQAMQQVRAGLRAIYVSGWQVAADANLAGHTYPDQSLYPANSVPQVVRRINAALQRADQIEHSEHLQAILDRKSNGSSNGNGNGNGNGMAIVGPGPFSPTSLHDIHLPGVKQANGNGKPAEARNQRIDRNWFAPIVADAEAGFGGPLNAHELMKSMIDAGAAGVHFEDQLSSEKKCGHLGGKVLIPTSHFVRTLVAARLAADICNVPTILIARTDADSAKLLTSDIDPQDHRFLTGERTSEGFFRIHGGLECAIARGLAYAPHADLLWCETSTPDLDEARRFADAIHAKHPTKMLAYNCSPSFNWKKNLDDATIARFQRELGAMGYKFQFVTLAGFHQLNFGMFELARAYRDEGMAAYSRLQQAEFAAEEFGYTATRHQREVGTGYFDGVSQLIAGGASSTLALNESTEAAQF